MASAMDLEDDTGNEGNEVVFEMDIYAAGSACLGKSAQGYLLQFPQRSVNKPYDDPFAVKLRPNVKRMQWDIQMNGVNYNPDSEHNLRAFSLQSSRVDPGMHGLAVGYRHENKLFLIPVSEVLQMRHSPTYLDKKDEKEQVAKRSAAEAVLKQEEASKELMPITVQVKKHETEQQTEARLRSYAFHSQQEEADAWVPLQYKNEEEDAATSLLEKLPKTVLRNEYVPATWAAEAYLDSIVPGSTSAIDPIMSDPDAVLNGDAGDLGRPAGQAGGGNLATEALSVLPNQLNLFFQQCPVLSLENIRELLKHVANNGVLNRAGVHASDHALHKAIMDAGNFICIRKSYTLKVLNNPALDPLRAVVLELLQEKEQVKRTEIMEAAAAKSIVVTDSMYQKVMKELCTSRGSNWSLRTGS